MITGPSRRFAANVISVAAAGNSRPTAAKIGSADQAGVVPASPIGAAATNSSAEVGMLIAAPAAGGTSRSPNCVSVSPSP